MDPLTEEIKTEVKHNSQVLNILSYWLKKSITGSKEKLRKYINITRDHLERTDKRLSALLKKKD